MREVRLQQKLEEVQKRKRELERQHFEVAEKVMKAKMIFDHLEKLRNRIKESLILEGLWEGRISTELNKITAATCDDVGIIVEEIMRDQDEATVDHIEAIKTSNNEQTEYTTSNGQPAGERGDPFSILEVCTTQVAAHETVINRDVEAVKEIGLMLKDNAKPLRQNSRKRRPAEPRDKQHPANYDGITHSELFLHSS